jgi:SAM-dependent methyltransferase
MRAVLLLLALAAATPPRAQEEVPFVTTPDHVTVAMLEIAKTGPEDYVIDLGSGDGRIVITAARRFGARGLGVEIVPDLVAKSREAAAAAGVADRAHFREQDLFKTDLSPASVITLYLLPEANLQLRPKLLKLRPGTRIVSHDWDMGDWQPDRTMRLDVRDKKIGLEKASRVLLWVVPARVDGAWCGMGKAKGKRLDITQSFQKFEARLAADPQPLAFDGRIEGAVLRAPSGLAFTYDGQQLHNTHAGGKFAAIHGAKFRPLRGTACK